MSPLSWDQGPGGSQGEGIWGSGDLGGRGRAAQCSVRTQLHLGRGGGPGDGGGEGCTAGAPDAQKRTPERENGVNRVSRQHKHFFKEEKGERQDGGECWCFPSSSVRS